MAGDADTTAVPLAAPTVDIAATSSAETLSTVTDQAIAPDFSLFNTDDPTDPVGSAAFDEATRAGQLTSAEVNAILQRASAADPFNSAIIAVVDRGGRVLGVRVGTNVSPTITGDADKLVLAVDGALAKARTGAFFGNSQAPLTSRTVQFISQTTMTQREVNSDPNIQDPNSTERGPGFISPVGINGHFPPNVPFTPQVDLFAIEHTNRDSIVHPGPDHIKGTPDDIPLDNRFNVSNAYIPAAIQDTGTGLTPPESYGLASGLLPNAQARGIGTLPGGLPIQRKVAVAGQAKPQITQIGGIGVFYPGTTGFATEENSKLNFRTFNAKQTDLSQVAEAVALAAINGTLDKVPILNRRLTFPTLGGVELTPNIGVGLPGNGRIDLVGITLDVIGARGNLGPQKTIEFVKRTTFSNGKKIGGGDVAAGVNLPVSNDVANTIFGFTTAPVNTSIYKNYTTIDPAQSDINPATGQPFGGVDLNVNPATNTRGGRIVPDGWLVDPHASADGTITVEDVKTIIANGIARANSTRAAIRLPLNRQVRMVYAVSDKDGNLLGVYRQPDSTIFSIDVAVAKARNVSYYNDPAELQPQDKLPSVPLGTAFTNRTIRYLSLPHFPEGIDVYPSGPFSILNDGGVNLTNATTVGPPLPASAFQSVQGYDAFNPGTNFHDPFNVANQNGIVFFPGSSGIYKTGPSGTKVLVGGFGVSGDGVDQDDVVTYSGSLGYRPTDVPRADEVFVRGVRLPYQKFNRNPKI